MDHDQPATSMANTMIGSSTRKEGMGAGHGAIGRRPNGITKGLVIARFMAQNLGTELCRSTDAGERRHHSHRNGGLNLAESHLESHALSEAPDSGPEVRGRRPGRSAWQDAIERAPLPRPAGPLHVC